MPLRFSPNRGAGAIALSAYVRGPTGSAATITVGTVTALAEGATPTVANSGTSSAAVFDFGIPRGAVPAIGFNFDTSTTDADPGAGDVRFNNATPASVTEIYFDNVDRDGNTVTAWLDSLDDSTSTSKGGLVVTPAASPSAKLFFTVSGSVVDGTGYRKVTVAHVAGTTLPSTGAHLAFEFARTGDVGTIGGSTGASDNRVLRADGVGGTTVQSSAVTIDDSGNVSGVGTITTSGGIELGNASDTTVARSGPGDVSVEGNAIYRAGGTDVPVADGGTGSSTAAGAATNLGLGTGDSPQFTGVNVGNASDTTVTRSAAGRIAVEGKDALLKGQTDDLSTAGYTSTSVSSGTKSSGTYTFDPTAGTVQHITNGGAFTLAPPSGHGSWMLDITNNASAGAITTSGWTQVDGSAFTTTNTHAFRCAMSVGNAGSYLTVKRMV